MVPSNTGTLELYLVSGTTRNRQEFISVLSQAAPTALRLVSTKPIYGKDSPPAHSISNKVPSGSSGHAERYSLRKDSEMTDTVAPVSNNARAGTLLINRSTSLALPTNPSGIPLHLGR